MKKGTDDFVLYGSVTVGERGQVVIPQKARQEIKINPGDKLLVFKGMKSSGVMFVKSNEIAKIISKMSDRLNVMEKALADVEKK